MENLLMMEGYCRYVTTLSCVRHHGTNPHFNHGITLLFFSPGTGLKTVSKKIRNGCLYPFSYGKGDETKYALYGLFHAADLILSAAAGCRLPWQKDDEVTKKFS
jgi:hypothetical protein